MMSTMLDNVIDVGFDNPPPMLKRSQYDSWQSRMLLYIQGKEHGEEGETRVEFLMLAMRSEAVEKSSEVLDHTVDRLQKLISQLEIHDESISQEDVNQKFLKSLSPEWNTHTIVWRNKPEIDTLSMDDLYNNLKIYEPEVKVNTGHGATTASTQATAVNSTTIDNLSDAVIYAFFASQLNSPQLDNEDLQ
ncbi:hypothetical protein Tco_0088934 [Tanacetum coccineum]